jgi:hypothetical protein
MMVTNRFAAPAAVFAAAFALACGSSAPPTVPVACEVTLDVSGAGENPLLLNETVTVYGLVKQNTAGCIPLTDKRVDFGTTEANIASIVQVTDTSAALTARGLGATRVIAFLRARRDITLVVPIVVIEESGEPIEDDATVIR